MQKKVNSLLCYKIMTVKRTSKTVGNVQDALSFKATQKNTDDAFLVSNLAHAIKVIHNGEKHQWMNDHLLERQLSKRASGSARLMLLSAHWHGHGYITGAVGFDHFGWMKSWCSR